jgi:hypothetical protein
MGEIDSGSRRCSGIREGGRLKGGKREIVGD